MNAGVIGQEGSKHATGNNRFYRGVRNTINCDRNVGHVLDRHQTPKAETLRVAQTIRTLEDLAQATSEARLLHGNGLRFTGLKPGQGSQTIMTFQKEK